MRTWRFLKSIGNRVLRRLGLGLAVKGGLSPLFASDWYIETYPDVALSRESPLDHYLRHGAAEGRNPNPMFATSWYLERYQDVAQSGENPLAHYLRIGAAEGCDPNPLFSTRWYVENNRDAMQLDENPLAHYLRNVGEWYLRFRRGPISGEPIVRYFQSIVQEKEKSSGLQNVNYDIEDAPALVQPGLFDTQLFAQRNSRVSADWEFLKETSRALVGQTDTRDAKRRFGARDLDRFNGETGKIKNVGKGLESLSERTRVGTLNILFVSYGPYDNNSAIHITGFANELADLGHNVVFSAMGPSSAAGDFGPPRFRCITHEDLTREPGLLAHGFNDAGNGSPDIVHCWTPRHAVRRVMQIVRAQYNCPYIIHFEDNEVAVADAHRSGGSLGLLTDDKTELATTLPATMQKFIDDAAGATVIVEALRSVLPRGMASHLLEPGVDTDLFVSDLDPLEREQICKALEVPSDAWIVVYPGNVHVANADDMFSLYVAIHALNAKGYKVQLIRTGIDGLPVTDPVFEVLSTRHVTNVGFVSRERLLELLKVADVFVQPGGPDEFNNYRLPSKVPEFLSMGRPVVLPRTNIGFLLKDRVNAMLMDRGDAAEITKCVEELLSDPAFAAEIGRAGRQFSIEHFNWGRSTKQLEGFYRQIL